MSILVKICGLKDEEQIIAAVDAGADAIGFVFANSLRRISPSRAAAISVSIPSRIKRVAVMKHPRSDEWQSVLEEFMPDVLQTDAADFADLDVPDSIERWPVYREGGAMPDTDGSYIYEGKKSGQGQAVDWNKAADIATNGNMILAGGLSAKNVAEVIRVVRPAGVDVSSAVESEPGQKDIQLIKEFIYAAKAAEKKS
jgi:phosphoribosylanthranilate isomerase